MLAIDLGALAIIAAGTLATYFFGIAPGRAAAETAASDQAILDAKEQELVEMSDRVKDKQRDLDKVVAELEASNHVLHPASEQYARLDALTELALGCELQVTETNPEQEVVGKRFNQVPIHIGGTGSYPHITDFIAAVHAKFEDVQVVAFKLTSHANDPKTPPHFEVDLAWYTSADPAGKPGSAAHAVGADGAGGGSGVASNGHRESGAGTGLANPAAPNNAGSH
jgi:Tfp pilus assembly protein PilO